MALTPAEKQERKRRRMIKDAEKWRTHVYCTKFVAPVFQEMIRAEAGARHACYAPAIVHGGITGVYRRVGECVCVTCGDVLPWKGTGRMHAGHFLAGRGNAILFDEDGIAPQCAVCNYHESGAQSLFRLWMIEIRGINCVRRLEGLKTTTRRFTKEELVDLRIEYQKRLDAAIERMKEA